MPVEKEPRRNKENKINRTKRSRKLCRVPTGQGISSVASVFLLAKSGPPVVPTVLGRFGGFSVHTRGERFFHQIMGLLRRMAGKTSDPGFGRGFEHRRRMHRKFLTHPPPQTLPIAHRMG